MMRSSKFTLKFATQSKRLMLDQLFVIYGCALQQTIALMWEGKVPLRQILSSKEITWLDGVGGQYRQLIYTHASEIVRSVKVKKGKKKSIPEVKNFTINFDRRMVKIETPIQTKEFDKWIRLRLPFIKEGKKLERIEILLPIREHKQSLEFTDWQRADSVKLGRNYVSLIYKKETPSIKSDGKTIGVDQGYKKLLVTSDGVFIGKDLEKLYEKITRKKQGSKSFKRSLIERDHKINQVINRDLNLNGIREIVIEDLKGIKQGTKGKIRKQFNSKLQRWVYAKSVGKLERLSEEEAVLLTRRSPAYTSQRCSKCGFIHKDNRKDEKFLCLNCGNEVDADWNASINLSQLGVYSPQSAESREWNRYPQISQLS